MITFINKKVDFEKETIKLKRIFNENCFFPERIFRNINIFIAFEFDLVYTNLFYEGLISFIKKIEDDSFTFYTINPSPDMYFYKHFEKYSAGIVSIMDDYDSFMNFLHSDPGNSADALAYNGETITLFSDNPIWGVVGSKDWEVGIVGFRNEATKYLFLESFKEDKDMFCSLSERIEDLDNMLHFSDKAKENYSKLLKNYSK